MQRKHICPRGEEKNCPFVWKATERNAVCGTWHEVWWHLPICCGGICNIRSTWRCLRPILAPRTASPQTGHCGGEARKRNQKKRPKNQNTSKIFLKSWCLLENGPYSKHFLETELQDLSVVRKLWRLLWVFSAMNNILAPQPKPVKPNA